MAEGYAKLLSSILDSSIWAEPDDAIRLWVTLLAMADKNGCVWASVGGIANRARTISIERTRELLRKFQQPDEDSRSKDLDGRRLVEIDRGFLIVNYANIRNMHADGNERARKRAWWEANRGVASKENQQHSDSLDASGASVTLGYGSGSDFVFEERARRPRKKRNPTPEVPMPDDWAPTPAHVAFSQKHNLDLELETAKFKGHFDGQLLKSWNGRFATWLANAVEYKRRDGSYSAQPAPVSPTSEPLVDALGNRKKPGQVFKNGHFIYPPGAEIK